MKERIDSCINEWKRRLIDLTRRNRLIYFVPKRSSSLQIIEPTPLEVFNRFVIEEKALKCFIPEEDEERDETAIQSNLPLGDLEEQSKSKGKRLRRSDEIICKAQETRVLRSVLRNLERRSRSDFEERGVRILHLAFGILEWQEVEQSELIRSPLLLVPVEIKRKSVLDPYEIWPTDEEIVINPALEVKLRNDFRIDLPALPEDWEEISLNEYLQKIIRLASKRGWSVFQECWIGLFSFHKLVIYQDLNAHHELINNHPIIIDLCEGKIRKENTGEFQDPSKLDSSVDPKESYLVLDADSSQLVCIETVKKGTNIVIQGPPGTGKSQTIANIISEFIASGRKVLFMSEKMAALEMVYKRLLNANLGHFCLEIHSHKANKRKVVEELYSSYRELIKPKKSMTEQEFQKLKDRCRQLNEYVYALHLVRKPMRRSAFEVLGELAKLESVPFVPYGEINPNIITPEMQDKAEQLARKLGQLWKVVAEGDQFIWLGCKVSAYSLQTRTTFLDLIANCEKVTDYLLEESKSFAENLGLNPPKSIAEGEWLVCTGELLLEGPGVPTNWLLSEQFDSFVAEAKRYCELSNHWRSLKEELGKRYDQQFFELPISLNEELKNLFKTISIYLGRDILPDKTIISNRIELLNWVHDLIQHVKDWQRDANILYSLVGLSADNQNIQELKRLIEIAELCSKENRPGYSWFDPSKLSEVTDALPRLRLDHQTRNEIRADLLRDYDISFLFLDLDRLIEDLKIRYTSVFRWLKPRFYSLRRQIRRCQHDGQFPKIILKDLEKARDLKRLEAKIMNDSESSKKLLGGWYKVYNTNFTLTEEAVEAARRLLSIIAIRPIPQELIQQACLGRTTSPDLIISAKRLKDSLKLWEEQTTKLSNLVPMDCLPSTRLPIQQSKLTDILNWAERLSEPLQKAITHIEKIQSSFRSALVRPPQEILSDLDDLVSLRKVEMEVKQESDRLKIVYGDRFIGLQTEWQDILHGLEWTKKLRDHFDNQPIPNIMLEKALLGSRVAPNVNSIKGRIASFHNAFTQFEKQFEQGYPRIGSVALKECPFQMQRTRLSEMRERIGEVQDWIDYQGLKEDFDHSGLLSLFTELTQRQLEPEKLTQIVSKSLLQAWIDYLFKEKSALRSFRGQNHEALVAEFRELDHKHCHLGASRVIFEANKRKPRWEFVVPGGEEQLLLHEAHKQRRHWPIRRLFAEIPNLLVRLKPCLLMSPLSVSQFLDPTRINFDLVIFDEASQIRTEDAVGAIYRGSKLVTCGDNKQLPPTAFFEEGMSEEYDDQEIEEAFDVFPSILDECVAIGMPLGWLRWHYRSKHESLIAFSNHQFYGNKLVTFPGSNSRDPKLGIEFRYIAGGVYDRSGRRDNPREAEEIVRLVSQHFFEYPNRSLGVVAFSIAQMTAIQDRIEKLMRERPELQSYFKEDRLEGFFIKNLENVQGDERDVMIFSVGYGKDASGKLDMRMFGPLTRAGGERRLNVAVTRAREKVILVSSIRAADLDLSNTRAPGVLALHRYLEYAERGAEALNLKMYEPGEFESPLEREVASAIRFLGYEVVPQVGYSGFRIDLGVIDPAEPGRYLLGVECDGATYHSAYTARDRDRLRQEILEKFGWRIHRVWSPDWVMRREKEVKRLSEAIEKALSSKENKLGDISHVEERKNFEIVIKKEPDPVNNDIHYPWVSPYKVWRPKKMPFQQPNVGVGELAKILNEIVDVEGPIHIELATRRLANALGFQKVGSRVREAVNSSVRILIKEGKVKRVNKFLGRAKIIFFWSVNPCLKKRTPSEQLNS
jgi:very-short-patch-repair endonuclease